MSKERRNPTVEEVIAYLETLPKDAEVKLSIKDHYSTHGETATLMDFDMTTTIWNHTYNKDCNWLTLNAHIDTKKPFFDGEVEKFPKITFRK